MMKRIILIFFISGSLLVSCDIESEEVNICSPPCHAVSIESRLNDEMKHQLLQQYMVSSLVYKSNLGQYDTLIIQREPPSNYAPNNSGCDCEGRGFTKLYHTGHQQTYYEAVLKGMIGSANTSTSLHIEINTASGPEDYFLPDIIANGETYYDVSMAKLDSPYTSGPVDSPAFIVESFYNTEYGLIRYRNLKGEVFGLVKP